MDKLIIKNKSGTLLSIPIGKFHLRMNPNDQIDLCALTGMGAEELERHPQVARNRSYNNIQIIEKYIHTEPSGVGELSEKIDQLMNIVSGVAGKQNTSSLTKEDVADLLKNLEYVSGGSQPASKQIDKNVVFEDDRLREELLRRQAESFDPKVKNTGAFGKNTQSIEVEDMSDLLDNLGE